MKKKRYTLPEEQPIPVGWHPANKEEAADKIEAIEAFRDDKLPSNVYLFFFMGSFLYSFLLNCLIRYLGLLLISHKSTKMTRSLASS